MKTTMQAYFQFTTLTGTNGFNQALNWPLFQGGSQLQDVYRYFEVTGWKVDVTLPTVVATTDSFYSGAVGFLPANFLIDGINTLVPTDPRDVLMLPGAVNVKDGLSNTGRWFPPPCKQVYPTSILLSGRTQLSGNLVGYFNDIGVNETPAVVEVYCDVVFYGIQLQNPSINYIKISAPDDSCEEIDDRISSKSLVRAGFNRPQISVRAKHV